MNRSILNKAILLILIIQIGCVYYKTVEIKDVSESSIEKSAESKIMVIIHEKGGSDSGLLEDFRIENDSIKGEIKKYRPFHEPHKKSVLKVSRGTEILPGAIHLFTNQEQLLLGEVAIPISSVLSVEVHEKDKEKTAIMTTLLVVGTTALGVVLGYYLFAASCGCPQVESIANGSTEFHGSLFPGSIFKSLKREDYLILENVLLDKDALNLRVYNSLPETEYMDELRLLQVDHRGYTMLGVNHENQFVGFNTTEDIFWMDFSGSFEASNSMKFRDDHTYQFDNRDQLEELNSVSS